MPAARAMVLCAGFGTRLLPLSDELPKPLVPIGDRSLLEHVLDVLDRAGFCPAAVNAHHLVEIFVERTSSWSRIAEVVHEPEIRGTAGGVRGARALFEPGPLVVTNGDVLVSFEPARLIERTSPDGLCLAVAPRQRGEGSVGIGEGGRVVRLRGERFGEELAGADYVGTMALGASVLAELPERGCLIGDVTLPLLRRGAPVLTDAIAAGWSAPGDGLADYLDANLAWLGARFPAPASFVAPGARVGGDVTLVSSLIGLGAEVSGHGRLERVVVWPGARAVAPLSDAVVTRSGSVVPRPVR
jgi:mannose-1-phosphate guanylyltransferase